MNTQRSSLSDAWGQNGAGHFCHHLNEFLKPIGWCVGLTGSVLFEGHSQKDLDIILYPRGNPKPISKMGLKLALEQYGLVDRTDDEFRLKRSNRDTKHVEVWQYDGRRVDIFFLS